MSYLTSTEIRACELWDGILAFIEVSKTELERKCGEDVKIELTDDNNCIWVVVDGIRATRISCRDTSNGFKVELMKASNLN